MSIFQRIKQSSFGMPEWVLERLREAEEKKSVTLDLSLTDNDQYERLTELPEQICQFSGLTALNLSGNLLSTLPGSIAQLQNLTVLNLSNNGGLNTLPASIAKLQNLTTLDLSRNQSSTLPEVIGQLRNLTTLDLSLNRLTVLPESIANLQMLIVLDLSRNHFSALPEVLTRLQNLAVLNLRGNKLKTLPEQLTQLKNLTELDLSFNHQLGSLPESIGQLRNLATLALSYNQLSTLPESIGQLQNLPALDLRSNQLSTLPESIGELQNLTAFDLSSNQLSTLPESIAELQNLTTLDLHSNRLNTLPESIGQLQNLTSLALSYNQLSTLPESIGQLQNLTALNLSYNQLSILPESISQLQNLTSLDLSHNQLSTLSESITRLQNLKNCYLQDNPLISPPIEIAAKGIEAVREYFRQLQQEGVDYLYEAKLLILGEGGAGKTTLANKLLNANYALRDEKSTAGVDVFKWSFPIEGDRQFTANIWDFGGQEIYHATHQFFLTRRSLYALVADTRKEDTDFYYWLNIAELLSDGSPLLIVKNEKQDRHREINERLLKGQFESLKEVLATNLATNRGLQAVKEEIEHYIQKLPHIGSPLPKTWVRVREKLEKDPRNYISLEEYLAICRENGFGETKDALQLSGYLNDIGVFLHFQDEPLLKRTVILKPKWGTDAVYKVLDNQTVIRNLGQFTREDLETIWDGPAYKSMRDELLQLMMKFKLCYEIPTQKGTYIAPQLLTENQPEYEWDEKENLLLRYSYEFMPKGILTQFIVAMHPYIWEQKNVWKSGLVIEKDRTRAEVIEYYSQREIRVRIAGPHGTDLMAIIRLELKQIHDAYRQLHYNELVPCNCSTCKDDQDPHFYRFEQLQKFVEKGILNVQCGRSGEMVNVRRLIKEGLNEEDTNEVRKTMSPDMVTPPEKAKRNGLFISYSHQDKHWLVKVRPHINVLEKMGIAVNLWDDTQIKAGMKWREEIEKALGSAKVAVLLVSTNFLNSDFISRDEIPPLLKAAQEDGATILPLILEPSLYTSYPNLKEYQAVNDPSRPLSKLSKSKQDEILVALSQRIIELMKEGG